MLWTEYWCLPKIRMLKLYFPKVGPLGGNEVSMRSWGWGPQDRIRVLIRKGRGTRAHFLCHVRKQQERVRIRKGGSHQHSNLLVPWSWISHFPNLGENTFLLLKAPSLWYFAVNMPEQTKTPWQVERERDSGRKLKGFSLVFSTRRPSNFILHGVPWVT